MRIINAKPENTAILWVTSRPRRNDWRATIVVKAAFRLVLDGIATADGVNPPVPSGDDPAEATSAPRYASDFAIYKPKTDLLVVGDAYAPSGKPSKRCRVSIGVADWKKSLVAVGDRNWSFGPLGATPGEPTPFVRTPIGYDRAFGGPGDRRNPLGRGNDIRTESKLPNIEHPDQLITQSISNPEPAGFGPLATNWQPRIGKIGTCDDRWRKQRWPWFPQDFDWSFFNAAPIDQQLPYFRGDETLAFENLHPEHALYRSRLPCVRARLVVQRRNQAFEEAKVNLDTVWIDVPAEQLVLVWRGIIRTESPRMRDLEAICTTLERLDAPNNFNALCDLFVRQRESESPNAASAAGAARRAAADQMLEQARARANDARATAAQHRSMAEGLYKATGLDNWRNRGPKPVEEQMAALEQAIAALKAKDPAKGQQLEDNLQAIDREIGKRSTKLLRQPAWTRGRVIAALASAESLERANLDGLDLSELNLHGADLRDATLKKCGLRGANLDGANLSRADLTGCDAVGASFLKANLTASTFKEAKMGAATFTGACIEAAIFTKIDLTGADFSSAFGNAADFTDSVLDAAYFARASLPRARFTSVTAAGADFSHATLPSADFSKAKAVSVIMENADLPNLRACGADFSQGRFARVRAPQSVWQNSVLDRADFSRALLTEAQFPEASLCEADFDRARLENVCFDDAALIGARLSNANLLRASFQRADLTEANGEGSNLYAASLLDADLTRASFRGSFVVQTQLAS